MMVIVAKEKNTVVWKGTISKKDLPEAQRIVQTIVASGKGLQVSPMKFDLLVDLGLIKVEVSPFN
jgi:hypothetical protein